jgi:hypothetical protein
MIVMGKDESVFFRKDRSVTKEYALVRRARVFLAGVSRGA